MEDVTISSEDQTDSSMSSSMSVQHKSIKQRFVAWKVRRSEKMKLRKRQDNRRRNKISKDDFYSKNVEFKAWLSEAKKLDLDMLQPLQAKTHFRTFVKKWNGRKLAAPYYRGVSTLWPDVSVSATPSGTISWTADDQVTATPGSADALLELHSRTDRSTSFSTFGKKRGVAASRELRCRSCFEPSANVRNSLLSSATKEQVVPMTSMPSRQTCATSQDTSKRTTTSFRTTISSQFGDAACVKAMRPSILRAATFTTKGQPEHRFSCIAALRYGENMPARQQTGLCTRHRDQDCVQATDPVHTAPSYACTKLGKPSIGLYDYSNIKNARESNV